MTRAGFCLRAGGFLLCWALAAEFFGAHGITALFPLALIADDARVMLGGVS